MFNENNKILELTPELLELKNEIKILLSIKPHLLYKIKFFKSESLIIVSAFGVDFIHIHSTEPLNVKRLFTVEKVIEAKKVKLNML